MNKFTVIICALFFTFFTGMAQTQKIPAFPGAEGGGMYTTGGRGGTVYFVTSLADTNTGNTTTREGTLRWCLGRSGTKTIVFKVSGIIELTSRLSIPANTTIAGQTAPGDGICLKNYDAIVNGSNVIVRFIRFRPGDSSGKESDAFWGRNQKNVIIDHCTMGWASDENSSFYWNENFTMQWCMLHEGLYTSVHDKGVHSYSGLWGGKNASFHHNFLVHSNGRNPRYNGWKRSGLDYKSPYDIETMDYRNNVVYNFNGGGYGGEAAGKYNVVNNYYKRGPANTSINIFLQIDKDGTTDPAIFPKHGEFYVTGNYFHGVPNIINDNTKGIRNNSGQSLATCLKTEPYDHFPVTTHSAEDAFDVVLNYSGASFARDTVERRIAREARTGTTTFTGSATAANARKKGFIDTPSDAEGYVLLNYQSTTPPVDTNRDGIPDDWFTANVPEEKNANSLNDEGYTYLEVYMNSLVQHIIDAQNEGGEGGPGDPGDPTDPPKEPNGEIIWAFDLGTAGQTATYSGEAEGKFNQDVMTFGSNLKIVSKNSGTFGGAYTSFAPNTESKNNPTADDKVSFALETKKDVYFTPTSVSFDCLRFGTNGGSINVKWESTDGTITTITDGIKPARDNDATSIQADVTHFETEISKVATVSGKGTLILEVYSLAPTKQIGFRNVKVAVAIDGSGTTSNKDIASDKAIVSTHYFDLVGKPVSKDTKGFVIVKVIYEDGSSRVQKQFLR